MTQVKQLMLTLHCLFPNELLLALDIVDRDLVRRYQIEHQHQQQDCHHPQAVNETATDSESPDHALHSSQEARSSGNDSPPPSSNGVFFVISTSSTGSSPPLDTRSRVPRTGQKGYEVRLHAWNCSCPTFALAAYRDPGPDDAHSHLPLPSSPTTRQSKSNNGRSCSFGGDLTHGATKLTPPVCKHLLACFLAERCPGVVNREDSFSASSSGTVLTADELACWCAGWG
ncbi:hypothetical protein BDW42DRAFT_176038, partial [Aspergillus taichungensis]